MRNPPPSAYTWQGGHLILFYKTMELTERFIADRREFIKISQAVGMGFLVMGAIGYVIKLSMFLQIFVQAISIPIDLPEWFNIAGKDAMSFNDAKITWNETDSIFPSTHPSE